MNAVLHWRLPEEKGFYTAGDHLGMGCKDYLGVDCKDDSRFLTLRNWINGRSLYRHILNAKTSQDGKSFIWLAFHLSEDTSKGHIKKKRTTNILNYDWL